MRGRIDATVSDGGTLVIGDGTTIVQATIVSREAAVEIGRRLAVLARRHQVLVVTHLPQVAAFADQHLAVQKGSNGSVTTSGVRVVEDSERARELSRMLAGLPDSDLGVAHAEELLSMARSPRRRRR